MSGKKDDASKSPKGEKSVKVGSHKVKKGIVVHRSSHGFGHVITHVAASEPKWADVGGGVLVRINNHNSHTGFVNPIHRGKGNKWESVSKVPAPPSNVVLTPTLENYVG